MNYFMNFINQENRSQFYPTKPTILLKMHKNYSKHKYSINSKPAQAGRFLLSVGA